MTNPPKEVQQREDGAVAWRNPEVPRHVLSTADKRDALAVVGSVGAVIAAACTEPLYTHSSSARDKALMQEALQFVSSRAEHDQRCEIFNLDDEDRHMACTCGFDALVHKLDARIKEMA